jgi:hypothetical protein
MRPPNHIVVSPVQYRNLAKLVIRTSCNTTNGENGANGSSGNGAKGGQGGSVYCASGISAAIGGAGGGGGGRQLAFLNHSLLLPCRYCAYERGW